MQVPKGPKTMATLRSNVSVGVQYLEAWLGGMGCVPLENLMEDAATAEICRTQVCSILAHVQRQIQSHLHDIKAAKMQSLTT